MWLPSMVYVLPCTHMPNTQLHHIQKKMVSISLSKRGYSSKTSRAVVFGPRRLLGIGDHHLYFEQGIGATLQLMKNIFKPWHIFNRMMSKNKSIPFCHKFRNSTMPQLSRQDKVLQLKKVSNVATSLVALLSGLPPRLLYKWLSCAELNQLLTGKIPLGIDYLRASCAQATKL
jgi:hypothetical protein